MAIEAEALQALSEKASQGEWSLGKAEGGYRFLNAAGIPSKPGPDRNVKWSGFARFVVEMEDDATCSGRSNLEFVAALVNAYRDGSLIHRSALAEDTARAAEGWQTIQNCPSDGRLILVFGGPWYLSPAPKEADGDWWRTSTARGLGAAPTHWRPLPAPPALPLDKEAADANR